MGLSESNEFELLARHAERLSPETDTQLRDRLHEIVAEFGSQRDAGLSRLGDRARQRMIKTLAEWGITEETPVVRQASLPVKEARLLPEYLRLEGGQAAIIVIESLIPQMVFQYKVCYGMGENLHDKWLMEGLEIDFPQPDNSLAVRVLSRDPAVHDIVLTPLTEAQGQDMLLDIRDVLGES